MFQQEYGYFQVTAKVPAGVGTWSGFWMLPANGLGGAELDAFEILGGYPNTLYTTTHSVNANGVHTADSIANVEPVDLTAAFHTYGVDWEPNQITWYLDGQKVASETPPPGFNTPMYILLNLALGGFGGTPAASTFPADMQIDSLQAYASTNTIYTSGSATIATASVAGTVTAGATPLANVTVGLVDAAGNLLKTVTTDGNGYFIFAQLTAGNYKVLYESPAGYRPGTGSSADQITGLTTALTLTDGQALLLTPETLVTGAASSLTGTLLKTPDGTSPAIPVSGEAVKLLSGNTVVDSTISAQDGTFLFTNLTPGSYTVQYTVQSGESFETGGPANVKTGVSSSVTVAAGKVTTMPVQTIMPTPGAVSGLVLYSATGMQGIAGGALPGATVSLLNQSGTAVATTVTDSTGNYLFSNVAAGQYDVQFASAAGYAFLNGSAADPVTGISAAAIYVTSANRSVVPTETLTASSAIASLNGTVLYNDGTDPVTPLAGVTVTLETGAGTAVTATTTNALGSYAFINLGAGAYEVAFSAPAGDAFLVAGPANFVSGTTAAITLVAQQIYQVAPETLIVNAPASISGTVLQAPVYTTSTGTGVALAGETISLVGANGLVISTTQSALNGTFGFSNLSAGNYSVRYALPATEGFQAGGPASVATGLTLAIAAQAGQAVSLAAETLAPLPATITGLVTYAGTPVNYVSVALINPLTGAVIQTSATNHTGYYTFSNLVAGSYEISYTAPKAEALQSGPADPVTGLTTAITVSAGSVVTLGTETLMPAPASVSGVIRLVSGLGQAGVSVAAINASTGSVVATTITAADGTFLLAGLTAGSYQVQITAPAGEYLSAGPANTTTGLTTAFTLSAGQLSLLSHSTLSVTTPATLSGTVLSAFNNGKAAVQAGIVVSLTNSGGTVTTTTNSSGVFQFKNLIAGSYTVSYTTPSGDTLLAGGPANPATAMATVTLTTGQSLSLASETVIVPAAIVTGMVLYAGVAAAAPEAGITVSLISAGQIIASTVTASNGAFQFTGLMSGAYQVSYTAPSGQQLPTGGSVAFTLSPGQTTALPAATLVPVPGYLGGTVLLAQAGLTVVDPGVVVTLLSMSGTIPTAIATATTDSNGVFQFAGLATATYEISYAAPTGQALQSGPAGSSGLTTPIALSATQTDILAAETLVVATASLSGSVLAAGAPQAGVTVALLNSAGVILATTTTNSGGVFQFNQLAADSYSLQYTAPAGETLQAGSVANTTTGITGGYSLVEGQALTVPSENLAVLIPTISGMVVHTGSGDPGTGQSAVTVYLMNASGTKLRTAVTGGSGVFSFQNVQAGTYELKYILPVAEAFQPGGPANATTGITAPFTFVSGEVLPITVQNAVSTSNNFTLNGSGAVAVRGDGNYTVTGSTSSGRLQLGDGNQSIVLSEFSETVTTGNGNQIISLLGTINDVTVGSGTQVINAGDGFETVTLGATPSGTTSTVTMTGPGDKLVATGSGNVSVSGPVGSASITLGDGSQSVILAGSNNVVTVGVGTSTINAGQNNNVIHAGGGDDTITVSGQSNLLDAGPGMNFYNATSGSRINTFMLNGNGQGLTTISGFNSSDTLDLARTVVGLGILNDFSNLRQFVTSSVSNGSTTLFIDPTIGSGTPYAFAMLNNTTASVAQLISGHNFSLRS